MCEPVSAGLAVASMAGNMMQQQAAYGQAQAQYQHDLAMTAAMRQRDEALFNLNRDLVNESTEQKFIQIDRQTLDQESLIAAKTRRDLDQIEEAAAVARTSAGESGVVLPPGLIQQHFAKKANVRAYGEKAKNTLRKNAVATQQQAIRDRDAAVLSQFPPVRMDPLAPQEPSMFGMLLGGLTAGMQGYVAGHQFGQAAGYIPS